MKSVKVIPKYFTREGLFTMLQQLLAKYTSTPDCQAVKHPHQIIMVYESAGQLAVNIVSRFATAQIVHSQEHLQHIAVFTLCGKSSC